MTDTTALAAAIAEGRTTARDAMAASLTRAQEVPGAIARMLSDHEALNLADMAEAGPFCGVPFLGKDLGSAAQGIGIAAGVPALRAKAQDPSEDSALFAAFRTSGLVPFGLTTVPEFGLALTTEPRGMPAAANPFDQNMSAGGSSGGAALAVASGIVAIAHATDAAGSIRVPAACCGLWGLKPSRGAIPTGPDFGNHLMGIASELVLARSLRDVVTAFHAVAGKAAVPQPDHPKRIGVFLPPETENSTAAALHKAAEQLAQAGHLVLPLTIPMELTNDCNRVARTILTVSLAEWVDALGLAEPDITPIAAAIAAEGRTISGTKVFAVTREVARITSEANSLFEDIDAILMPVLLGQPPKIGSFPDTETSPAARFARMAKIAPISSLANVAGLPALAFPAGFTNGLPIGAQLVGPLEQDAELLALASCLAHCVDIPFPHPIAGLPT